MSHRHMEFKDETVRDRYPRMHPYCREIAEEMAEWCEERKIPFVITETVTTLGEDNRLERASSTHRTGRAFDVRTKDWLEKAISEFMAEFERRFRHLGAVNKRGEVVFLLRHDTGRGDHIHVQIGATFAIQDPLKKR